MIGVGPQISRGFSPLRRRAQVRDLSPIARNPNATRAAAGIRTDEARRPSALTSLNLRTLARWRTATGSRPRLPVSGRPSAACRPPGGQLPNSVAATVLARRLPQHLPELAAAVVERPLPELEREQAPELAAEPLLAMHPFQDLAVVD